MLHTLYGDGLHDDTAALQELIDTSGVALALPAPEKFYLISRPLELPSNFSLTLPRFAEIRLADGSNCTMIKNRLTVDDDAPEIAPDSPFHFPEYARRFKKCPASRNIELRGGIWNCNNLGQNPNPIQTRDFSVREFWGYGMIFYKVEGLILADLTVKDPTNFGVTLDTVSYFTAENIVFDYNLGNPKAINMDGLHFNGNCHFGVIRNLKGTCYDDLVALNADEGTKGPITNISIDGLFAENCHSAVRLLTVRQRIENIRISNVFGTYYKYCIGLTKYYNGQSEGYYDGIFIDHVLASKAVRQRDVYPWPDSYVYSLIWVDKETLVRNLKITNLSRKEYNNPVSTVCVRQGSVIERLILDSVSTENLTSEGNMPLIKNGGEIRELVLRDVYGCTEIEDDGGTVLNLKNN